MNDYCGEYIGVFNIINSHVTTLNNCDTLMNFNVSLAVLSLYMEEEGSWGHTYYKLV